ncbi:MAG TPA: anthranilate synthase component I [Firmicutes bacterium]|nr:anthranilate synthase component I [Bacillota bacterium]
MTKKPHDLFFHHPAHLHIPAEKNPSSQYPDPGEYQRLAARGYKYIPLFRRLRADCLTPVSAFLAVGNRAGSFLLESVEKGMNIGRYSFIGFDPLFTLKSTGPEVELTGLGRAEKFSGGDPLDLLAKTLMELKVSPLPPDTVFYGGAVGYLAYDYVRQLEEIPALRPDLLHLPDAWWMVPRSLIIFDHVTREIMLVVLASTAEEDGYHRAAAKIEELRIVLLKSRPGPPERINHPGPAGVAFTFTRQEFMQAVQKAREYIFSGEILQVVLSQRMGFPYDGDPFAYYRVLRNINPSPYLFYIHCGDHQVIGSSPEMLARLKGQAAEIRPIAGTRPRALPGRSEESLRRELVADEKEQAEHLILLDLGCNELEKVCRYGTVRVEEFMAVEEYSHVMHLVSSVKGEMAPGKDAFSLLKAVFPAGTLTGAPKVRAMEIIEELEPCRRGFYGGAVGYLGFDGQMDTCIGIRSAVAAGGRIHLQAGAGIVADSDPGREYQETIYKLQALLSAFSLLERGGDGWL